MNFHDPILCKNYDTVYSTSQPDIIFIKKKSSPYWYITKEKNRFSVLAEQLDKNIRYKVYFDKYEDLVAFIC